MKTMHLGTALALISCVLALDGTFLKSTDIMIAAVVVMAAAAFITGVAVLILEEK